MAKIRETINFGNKEDLPLDLIAKEFEKAHKDLAIAVNGKPDLVVRDVAGSNTENFLSDGTINIDTTGPTVEIITSRSASGATVTWTAI